MNAQMCAALLSVIGRLELELQARENLIAQLTEQRDVAVRELDELQGTHADTDDCPTPYPGFLRTLYGSGQ